MLSRQSPRCPLGFDQKRGVDGRHNDGQVEVWMVREVRSDYADAAFTRDVIEGLRAQPGMRKRRAMSSGVGLSFALSSKKGWCIFGDF